MTEREAASDLEPAAEQGCYLVEEKLSSLLPRGLRFHWAKASGSEFEQEFDLHCLRHQTGES